MYKLEEVPQDNTLYETLTEHNVDIIILENLKQVCLSASPPPSPLFVCALFGF